MCGIAGIINKRANSFDMRDCLDSLQQSLYHRGPDDSGEFRAGRYGFAHRRLSIVDRAGGHQPIFNEDGSLGIIYNGEVYNYKILRGELEGKGYRFHTNTDTEVILKAFEESGVDSFDKFNGMFAFCIWNLKEDVVYLVRDCFGIKPLYIYEDGTRLIFSSELKGLLGIDGLDFSLDPAGFQDYLMFRYVQAPYTFFSKIRRLEAGTYLEIKKGQSSQYRYWDVSYSSPYPYPDAVEARNELLIKIHNAVKSQLMGEVPIGVLLSGGVDSSAIAYFVHKLGADLTTFNIGFPEVNEFQYSRSVAKKYGLKHVEILTTREELADNLDSVISALDEPIADPACFPLYILARELKKHVTVVLSGEGGDELFAGYPQYSNLLKEGVSYSRRFDNFLQKSWYFRNYLDFLNDPSIPPHPMRFRKYFEEQPLLNGMLSYDMKTWMPENLMMKADKIMMAHSLEGRFPFLDREVFRFASALPQAYKLNLKEGISKWILKDAIKPYLPKSIVQRPKMGFTVPVAELLEDFKPLIVATCENARGSNISEVLNIGHIRTFVHGYYKKGAVTPIQIWTLFVLLYWFETNKKCYNSEE
ncbi:MAG: asparagine synthase (glutamine-hydrolyzing) [Nitrospiraceae bacterium]|nr:asparagine synthase (glutamine-hydrolyzing) [Nitrospiraceae bacterium]